MSDRATPARYIRTEVFRCETQLEFAKLVGFTSAEISRFESGQRQLSRGAQKKIRQAARSRGLPWDDTWLFEIQQ